MREKVKYVSSVIITVVLVITTISVSSYACIAAAKGNDLADTITYSYEAE